MGFKTQCQLCIYDMSYKFNLIPQGHRPDSLAGSGILYKMLALMIRVLYSYNKLTPGIMSSETERGYS